MSPEFRKRFVEPANGSAYASRMTSRATFNPTPRKLAIKDFSAIREADIVLNSLTILTGPQASGKSLICKINYFFQDFVDEMFRSVIEGQNLQTYEKSQAGRFSDWFPPSAWGAGKFEILYVSGDISMRVYRASASRKRGSDVGFEVGKNLSNAYAEMQEAYSSFKSKAGSRPEIAYITPEQNWRFREQFYKIIDRKFNQSLTASQTYIPASRAFFTTMGKAMAAFEHGQFLDPITKSFGRLYGGLFDRMRHGFPITYSYHGAVSRESKYRNNRMAEIFGGRPIIVKNEMVIESDDGRIIPFNALSSGQQELLPLWLSLGYYESFQSYTENTSGSRFLYIEEPEAHLFPEAQTGILDILATLLGRVEIRSQMIITTHSPYLLAQANNLLLAGRMGFRKRHEKQARIEEILPKSRWLLEKNISCYGIEDGIAINLMGEDGLILTDYIDGVSQCIVDQFSDLLDIGL